MVNQFSPFPPVLEDPTGSTFRNWTGPGLYSMQQLLMLMVLIRMAVLRVDITDPSAVTANVSDIEIFMVMLGL